MTSAIIVAAGRGSRLGPSTEILPKPLTEFHGRALLDWQLRTLRSCGVEDVHLVRGYMAEKFDNPTLTYWLNPEWATTNMVASLFCASDLLERSDDLLICYGDIIYEPRILKMLLDSGADASLIVDDNWQDLWSLRMEDPLSDAETMMISEDGCINDLGRKPDPDDRIDSQYIGLMRFKRDALEKLHLLYKGLDGSEPWLMGRTKENCYMTDFLRGAIENGLSIQAVRVNGGWLEVDTQDDLKAYSTAAHNGRLSSFISMDAL